MLSPEEELELREKVRRELEEAEAERIRQKRLLEEQEKKKRLEQERERIILEEKEKFYKEWGLHKYVNHFGRVEWLTPEEIEDRKKKVVRRKRVNSKHSKHHSRRVRKVLDLVLLGVVLLVGVGVTMYLAGTSQLNSDSCGSLWICSDVKDAAIFIDGKLSGRVTDALIEKIKEGEHTVSVSRPGYSAFPQQVQVKVLRGETVKLEFRLRKVD